MTKKLFTLASGFLVVCAIAGFSFLPMVQAATFEELQSQINALQNQLGQLQGSTPTIQGLPAACSNIIFFKNLAVASSGPEVLCLQSILNQDAKTQVAISGPGSKGSETAVFGLATKRAVIKFQAKYGISQVGSVGPATMAKLNALIASWKGATSSASPSPTPTLVTPLPTPLVSQTDTTILAISKAAPAVVSIVITKEVPQYEVVYQNPFANDPFFQNAGIQIPVYRPTGKTVSQKVGAGTGFLVTSSGYIVTNKHVVADEQATYVATLSTGVQQPLRIVHKDSQNDIAILKIEGTGYPVIVLGDSNSLQLGQPIIAIGNALGQFSNSVSLGIVSGLNRSIEAFSGAGSVETLAGVIQTDAAINPGNSGGPLLDLQARAVGINVAMVQGSSNISFAIPINSVSAIIKSVAGF